ncbi:MAG: ATP-binding protein [Longimicrobiales bacterium]
MGFTEVDDRGTIAYAHHVDPTLHIVRRDADTAYVTRTVDQVPSWTIGGSPGQGVWVAGFGIRRIHFDSVPGAADRIASDETFSAEQGLSGRFATDVLFDREGTIWVTTDRGLDRLRRRRLTWKRDPSGDLAMSLVIGATGDALLLTSDPPTVRRAEDFSAVLESPVPIDNGYRDSERTVWLSTLTSLVRWDASGLDTVPPPVLPDGMPFAVLGMARQQSGRLWVSVTGSGLFHLDDGAWTFRSILPGRGDWAPVDMQTDRDDRLWLAYRDQVAVVVGDSVRIFDRSDGLGIAPLTALAADREFVWAGGEQGLVFTRGDRFHPLRLVDDLNLSVASIVPTNDGLWLGTSSGIVHVPREEIKQLERDISYPVRSELFAVDSDLPDPLRFTNSARTLRWAAEDGSGVLWFLTNSGVARLDPRRITKNRLPPPVAIRQVVMDDSAFHPGERVLVPPHTRTLRIEYTALSLVMPERVQFRHRLEGWDNAWRDGGNRREVTFTDLRPGTYRLQVAASNNDGVWNEAGTMLAVTVMPAWYQTGWFQLLIVIAILGAAATAYRFRMQRMQAGLAARYHAQLMERTRIARELHDTFLQTVQGSKMVAEDALDRSEDVDNLRAAMDRVARWLGQAAEEGRAALSSLRAASPDSDIAESLRRAAEAAAAPSRMSVHLETVGKRRDLHPVIQDEVHRIGCEAIHNACQHSRGTRLTIEVQYGQAFTLRITDDGMGMDSDVANAGKPGRFGLKGMRERAVAIEGALTIDSASGTRIALVVPGRIAFGNARNASSHHNLPPLT